MLKYNTVQTTSVISDTLPWMLSLGLRLSILKYGHLFHKLVSQMSSILDYKIRTSLLPHLFLVSAMQQRLTAEGQLGTDAIFSPLKFMIKASQLNAPRSVFMSNECFKIIVWVQLGKNIVCSQSGLLYIHYVWI